MAFFITTIAHNITDIPIAFLLFLVRLFELFNANFYGKSRAFLRAIALFAIAVLAILLFLLASFVNLR